MNGTKPVIVDCRGHLLGRLSSIIAKQLLTGNSVVCVRTEQINISGSRTSVCLRAARGRIACTWRVCRCCGVTAPVGCVVRVWHLWPPLTRCCCPELRLPQQAQVLREAAQAPQHQPQAWPLPLPRSQPHLVPHHPWHDPAQVLPRQAGSGPLEGALLQHRCDCVALLLALAATRRVITV